MRRWIMTAAVIAVPFALFTMKCGRDVREVKDKTNVVAREGSDTALKEEYKHEGFISSGVFRVVIVEPTEAAGEDLARAGSTAKKRAYLSLKKYLVSGDRIVTANVDASLLNLIEREGQLTRIEEDKSLTRRVYFFDIKKTDLKGYIDGLAPKR